MSSSFMGTEMSDSLGSDNYRALPTDKLSWRASGKGVDCDECTALQYESRGRYKREKARHVRAISGTGPLLHLCVRHAEAWRARDAYELDR